MGLEHVLSSPSSSSSPINSLSKGESVMVVMDANRSKGTVDALEWALNHVVRPKDTVVVIGVMCDIGKRPSCFPFLMGISISGIWERLEFSHSEKSPREVEEEIEKKKEQYQCSLQPFYRQCKKNEVKLEVKLAAGYEPKEITIQEAQNSNTRWIVLDSHLKKDRLYIYRHVDSNVAVMKGKNVATLMPSKATDFGVQHQKVPTLMPSKAPYYGQQPEKLPDEPPSTPHWYPLAWRTSFPRSFSHEEVEEITNGFSDGNKVLDNEEMKVYRGILQDTPIIVKSVSAHDERFWSMLKILCRARHRNIMNLVGYCSTDISLFILFDYPSMGSLVSNLQCDESAKKLTWKVRWCIALEIGGSLRYLHEECFDEPVFHHSVCSSSIVVSHGYRAMLGNFTTAKWMKDHFLHNEDTPAQCLNLDEGCVHVDVRDYGAFLLELLSGKTADWFKAQSDDQTLVNWALPLLENGSLSELMDPRLDDTSDAGLAPQMAQAALRCLKHSLGHKLSMSEVLAVVRGDRLAMSKCQIP